MSGTCLVLAVALQTRRQYGDGDDFGDRTGMAISISCLQVSGTQLRVWVPVVGAGLPWSMGRQRDLDPSRLFPNFFPLWASVPKWSSRVKQLWSCLTPVGVVSWSYSPSIGRGTGGKTGKDLLPEPQLPPLSNEDKNA